MACFVLFGIAFSFIKLISSSDTSTKREAAILKICPPTIITSPEVIIAGYDAILSQWECANLYNHLSNYTNIIYYYQFLFKSCCDGYPPLKDPSYVDGDDHFVAHFMVGKQ